jgi:hypothetical protein
VNFIFSQNFISLFWGLLNDEIDLRIRYMSTSSSSFVPLVYTSSFSFSSSNFLAFESKIVFHIFKYIIISNYRKMEEKSTQGNNIQLFLWMNEDNLIQLCGTSLWSCCASRTSKVQLVVFCFWLCLLLCRLLWSDLTEMVSVMEWDPSCLMEIFYGKWGTTTEDNWCRAFKRTKRGGQGQYMKLAEDRKGKQIYFL